MENKCLLDTELFDFFCEQFGEIKSHEIPASAVTLLKNNAKDNTPVNDTKVFNILKAYNQCVAQQHSMHFAYYGFDALTTHTFSSNNVRSAQEILDNITKYTSSLTASITIDGNFDEGFIAINETTQEQILCDIEWRLYVCAETESIPAETSYEQIFHTQTNIIEGDEYKLECIIHDREYASRWRWDETYQNVSNHLANEIPMTTIYPDTVSDENQYFYITTKYKASGTAFSVTPNNVNMYLYCSITDPYHWQSFTSSTLTNVTLEENTKIYFKTTINTQSYDTNISVISFYNNQFIKTTGGNIMSLVYGDNFINQTSVDLNYSNLFAELFSNCSSLKTAKHLVLPIEHVPEYGYNYMFADCSSLIYAPEEISATILEDYACENMFSNCTSLIYAPEILAVRAWDYAMDAMFASCESLKYVPDLHIMFCGESTCEQMFVNCTSLECAPKIPILTLTSYCCDGMFSGCENLKYIDAAFMDAPSSSTNSSWVQDVSSTGTFVKNINADWNEASVRGDNGVPSGWTVITAKPEKEFEYMVEYIATDGQAYIDTGIMQYTHADEIIMSTPTVTNINFFGSQESSSRKFVVSYNTSNKWKIEYGSTSGTNSTTLVANTKYKMVSSGGREWSITNLSSNSSFSMSGSGRGIQFQYSTYLFAVNNAGTPILSGCNGLKCYRATFTNNSTLICDFIPVRIGSKGYMYNRVTKTLIKNAGSGMFTPGPDIIPIEYLSSSGQPTYIDLPLSISLGGGININAEIIPVYTSSYTYPSILAVTANGPNTTQAYNGVIIKYKSYSNNIITYSSSIMNSSTNGDFMMDVNKHGKFIVSTSNVISSYTYTSVSRSFQGATINIRIFAGYESTNIPNGYPVKICHLTVKINAADYTHYDLIPVKLNNIGYMYDTLTGTLYGNNGPSSYSFTCGPEIFKHIE